MIELHCEESNRKEKVFESITVVNLTSLLVMADELATRNIAKFVCDFVDDELTEISSPRLCLVVDKKNFKLPEIKMDFKTKLLQTGC